ncbi:hypothetical protein H6F51_02420 [Cyanobacteria bacterium FACHB-DQ100]|uniref:hypothetical protein n=1 Tax=Leptolyngbya sp. DQ-M1 TaxID=2933920 RepID=UPI0019ABDD57|nr:hypothetical protein [Cyanobacteria bacterium FACHB-DQ100]
MSDYRLVDCDFYDQLEALATLHQVCSIVYRNALGETIEVYDRIVDVYAANKADFLRLNSGTEIRLDHLIAVNSNPIRFAQT